jgi:hypothetical protein
MPKFQLYLHLSIEMNTWIKFAVKTMLISIATIFKGVIFMKLAHMKAWIVVFEIYIHRQNMITITDLK